jgi:arylsulfatase A-like enzyme
MTEHRLVRKGASMYDCLTRVPLLVSWPGTIGPGQVSENLVSTLDVFSTLTHLMALPMPPGRNGQPLPVTPALADAAPPRRFIVSEHGTPREALTREKVQQRLAAMAAAGRPHRLPFQLVASGPKKMVRTHEWKYVYRAGGEDELYDLRADPHELANLAGAPEQRDRIEALRRNLLDWMTETEEDDVSPIAGGDVSMRGERSAG